MLILCSNVPLENADKIREHKHQYVIALDIDHFKSVNDRFGHATGDAVLIHIAGLLSRTCRGGEEFIVLLPDATLYAASALAERIRVTVAGTDFPVAGRMTVSAGVAGLLESGGDRGTMLKTADRALYEAKREGRNRVICHPASPSFPCG